MLERTLRSLEYDKILALLSKCAVSGVAKDRILALQPITDVAEAELLLNQTAEADRALYEYSVSPNFAVDDISTSLDRAEVLATLSMGELLKVARVLRIARDVRVSINKVPDLNCLLDFTQRIFTNKALEEDIDKAIINDTEMRDTASADLKAIRNKIRRLNDGIKAKLNEFVTSPNYSKYLQDGIVTIRGDRYVIPVKAEFKGAIAGLVHDQSASGQTLFVEPMQVVELNNELKTQLLEEQAEIERILRAFTVRVSDDVSGMRTNMNMITALDAIFAKAKFARGFKGVRPSLNDKGYVNIVKGRHLLIPSAGVVPTTIYLGKDFNILLVTGPNTGGKTVTLKLVGLFSLMAMSGMFIPAQSAELSIFDGVYCDIGDEQSIEQSLSTFSGHITNIINILNAFTSKSLLLLDELGAGTDPSEGAALAVAITKHIQEVGARAVITSHYNELKEYSVSADGVENASMDFNATTFAPTYKLIIGVAGASNALYIAKRLGLNDKVLAEAEALVAGESRDFNRVLLSAEKARQEAEQYTLEAKKNKELAEAELAEARAEREKLKLRAEKLNENIRLETKKAISSVSAEAAEIIDEMKELLKSADEKALFEARKLKKKLDAMQSEDEVIVEEPDVEYAEDDEIRVGDSVYFAPLQAIGVVESINKSDITLKLGRANSKVKLSDCKKITPKGKAPQRIVKGASAVVTREIKSSVNLIGQSREEALINLDAFIDQAVLGHLETVTVIHGKGTGALRTAVQISLKANPAVKGFRDGRYGEGERGVTIVTLK